MQTRAKHLLIVCYSTVEFIFHLCRRPRHTESVEIELMFNVKEEQPVSLMDKKKNLSRAFRAGQHATCGCQNIVSPCYF